MTEVQTLSADASGDNKNYLTTQVQAAFIISYLKHSSGIL